jgi:hypothetical protein
MFASSWYSQVFRCLSSTSPEVVEAQALSGHVEIHEGDQG